MFSTDYYYKNGNFHISSLSLRGFTSSYGVIRSCKSKKDRQCNG